jgi:hypothetical protein
VCITGLESESRRHRRRSEAALCLGASANSSGTQALLPERGLNVPMGMIDADADAVLSLLLDGLRRVLGVDLVGSYLFRIGRDGDVRAGIERRRYGRRTPIRPDGDAPGGPERTPRRHRPRNAEWDERIEAVYLSTSALTNFRRTSPAARLSPGEPFHPIEVDHRWLMHWYQLRTVGTALYGPPVTQVAPPITQDEYVDAVRHTCWTPDGSTRPSLPGIARTRSSPCAVAFEHSEPASTSPSEKGRGGRLRSCPSTLRSLRVPWRGEGGAKTGPWIPA